MYRMLDIGDVVQADDLIAVSVQGDLGPYISWQKVNANNIGETIAWSPCLVMRKIDIDVAKLKLVAQKFRLDTDGKERCTLDDLEIAAKFLTLMAGEDYVFKTLLGV